MSKPSFFTSKPLLTSKALTSTRRRVLLSPQYRWCPELYEWPEALYAAYRGDTRALSKYLRRNDAPLDQNKREQLAELIDRRIGSSGKRGRKPGRIPPRDPGFITADFIAGLARGEVERLKQANGGKTPRGAYREAIDGACEFLGHFGNDINEAEADKALKILKRG
jgi:hypothetical protein